MSIMEICAVNIDWSNVYDPIRVVRYSIDLREKYPIHNQEDHRVYVAKFKEWLEQRGPSTSENISEAVA